jgi:putative Ca2+/H+ antiporter (TMEM165/GDT1 family)
VLVGSFLLVLVVVGGIELVDRTNFALIGLAARQSARDSWLGAASAFLLTSTIAVAIGSAFLAAVGGQVHDIQLGGGLFLLGYAGYIALVPEADRKPPTGRSAFASAFLLIFLLELGDTTMILLIVFTGAIGNPVVVLAGGSLGLLLVAASACLIGSRLGARVEPRAMERVVVVILAVVGVLTVLSALDPGLVPAL